MLVHVVPRRQRRPGKTWLFLPRSVRISGGDRCKQRAFIFQTYASGERVKHLVVNTQRNGQHEAHTHIALLMDACPCDVALSIRVVGAARRSEREHVLMAWSMLACTRQRRPAGATKFGCSPRVDPCQVPARGLHSAVAMLLPCCYWEVARICNDGITAVRAAAIRSRPSRWIVASGGA